jgi:hypothetical protein
MAIPSKGIGWGTESNLLWQIAKQIQYLTQVTGTSLSSLISQTITCGVTDKAPSEDAVCQALALKQDILGKISLSDPDYAFFSDLISARAYVQTYTSATITQEGYNSETSTYTFTVPLGSEFELQDYFCGNALMNFQDPNGLVVNFGNTCFLYNSTNNVFGDVTAGGGFLSYSSGNNTIGNVNSTYEFLSYSSGNNTIGNVTTTGSFLQESTGNNTMGDVTAEENFLKSSLGNNVIGNVTAGENFLYESLGNNVIGDVIASNHFLEGSTGNNTMNTIYVTDDAFAGATPTIKNSIYKIDTCGIGFAVNYKGRIDIGLWGSDGDQNLPSDIFITTNLTWIHTFYSNRFNFTGGPDRDIVQALANMSNVNSIVIYE